MATGLAEIKVIEQAAYFAASDLPEIREGIRLLYEQVEDRIQQDIKRTVRGQDFFPLDICIDWEKGEMTAKAAVDLRFKFVRSEDGIEIVEMNRAY